MNYTFGKTKACEKLEGLLKNNPRASRRVSRLLSHYTSKLFHVTGARDPYTVLTCMELLREQALKQIDEMKLDKDITSLTRNLVICRYRAYWKSFKSLIPFLDVGKKNGIDI